MVRAAGAYARRETACYETHAPPRWIRPRGDTPCSATRSRISPIMFSFVTSPQSSPRTARPRRLCWRIWPRSMPASSTCRRRIPRCSRIASGSWGSRKTRRSGASAPPARPGSSLRSSPRFADGRLNLSAVLLLTPHLTPENADELLGAATHKRKAELDCLLAERFPQPDVATLVQALPTPAAAPQLAPAPVSDHVNPLPPTPVAPRPRVTPLAPERFALQLTISQRAHDNLRYAQALLGHAVPSGDLAQVLERALEALIERLEKRRFAAASRSRTPAWRTPKGRHHPGRRASRSLAARRWPVHVRQRQGSSLRGANSGSSTTT